MLHIDLAIKYIIWNAAQYRTAGNFFVGAKFGEISPLEEFFVILIFMPCPHGDHTHVDRSDVCDSVV
jgi:hypothetical protein